MCGVAAEPATSPQVAAGQRHHVEVDARFHDNSAFTGLYTWGARALVQAGLPRGPARGAAHVGIELFLDGLLSDDVPARAAYARCLAEAESADAPLAFADEPSHHRWRSPGSDHAPRSRSAGTLPLPRSRRRGARAIQLSTRAPRGRSSSGPGPSCRARCPRAGGARIAYPRGRAHGHSGGRVDRPPSFIGARPGAVSWSQHHIGALSLTSHRQRSNRSGPPSPDSSALSSRRPSMLKKRSRCGARCSASREPRMPNAKSVARRA